MNAKIQDWMIFFQNAYKQMAVDKVENFMEKAFIFDEDTVIIGTQLNEWYHDESGVKELLGNHFTDFGQLDFKFSEASVFESNDDVFICSIAELSKTVEKDTLYQSVIESSLELLTSTDDNYYKTQQVGRKIAKALVDAEQGSHYQHPLRFNVVLKEVDGVMKAHHMQFSFDAEFLWQHRYTDERSLLPYFEMAKRNDHTEIRNLLNNFQEGYDHREVKSLDSFVEMFTGSEDMITIGTDAEEFFEGPEELKEIIESDWIYWGDFKINCDGAVIVEHENSAYFATKATLHKTHTLDVMKDSSVQLAKAKLEDDTSTSKEKLLNTLHSVLSFNQEIELGEHYYSPMRFTGYLLKVEGKWQFQHIQYSDYILEPEKRL